MGNLSFRAPLEAYQREAEALFGALQRSEPDAAWQFKWLHPRFRGQGVEAVRNATLDQSDAQQVVACEYAFDTWPDLAAFVEAVASEGPVATFETAVEAVVFGDIEALRALLRAQPDLVHTRSTRQHHATLLHYVAANGVEGSRQRTPPNIVEIASLLLNAGAEPDALADMYEQRCTTMSMLVSSGHPAKAGFQIPLAETLLDHGAALVGPGTAWQSAVLTALTFGFLETAEALVRRGAPLDHVAAAAGLGRVEETARLLLAADGEAKRAALALAAAHGQARVVQLLLAAGVDPNRYNPDGYHSHSTPLHQAVWADHRQVVQILVERGARLDLRDHVYDGTPLDWAVYGGRQAIAEYLRGQTDAR